MTTQFVSYFAWRKKRICISSRARSLARAETRESYGTVARGSLAAGGQKLRRIRGKRASSPRRVGRNEKGSRCGFREAHHKDGT
jgi:hypothetical protein